MRTPSGREVRTIAILCRNHRGFVDALGAATKLGANALLLNTGFSGPQLADVVAREKAELVIYDEEFAGLVEHARTEVGDLVELVAWQDRPDGGSPVARGRDPRRRREQAAQAGRSAKVILLTSGTTGTPKGAARGADGGTNAMAAMLDRIPWRAGETRRGRRAHVPRVGLRPARHRGDAGVHGRHPSPVRPRGHPRDGRSSGATGLGVVPVMIERIMELPDEVLDRYRLKGRLRFVTASGSRMRGDAVLAFMDRFGDTVYNSYNATEAGLISTAVPADLRVAPDTAGKPVVGTELRILDDATARSPGRGRPDHGAQRLPVLRLHLRRHQDVPRRLHGLGDVGRVDEEGRLYVVGRDDEMIVSGGENVYPLEVEETLNAHPAVREAAVVGVDDEKYGQRLAAYVAPSPAPSDRGGPRAHVKAQLAGYKVPRDVTLSTSCRATRPARS